MSKKIEETIVIRNEKMSYAVRLCSKLDGEGSRLENRNPVYGSRGRENKVFG